MFNMHTVGGQDKEAEMKTNLMCVKERWESNSGRKNFGGTKTRTSESQGNPTGNSKEEETNVWKASSDENIVLVPKKGSQFCFVNFSKKGDAHTATMVTPLISTTTKNTAKHNLLKPSRPRIQYPFHLSEEGKRFNYLNLGGVH